MISKKPKSKSKKPKDLKHKVSKEDKDEESKKCLKLKEHLQEISETDPLNELRQKLQDVLPRHDNYMDYCEDTDYVYPDYGFPGTPTGTLNEQVNDTIDNIPILKYHLPTWEELNSTKTEVEVEGETILPKGARASLKDFTRTFPLIHKTGRLKCFNLLAEFMKCTKYKLSFLEFWFIDIIEECIYYSQPCVNFSPKHMVYILDYLMNFIYGVKHLHLDLNGMFHLFEIDILKFNGKFNPTVTDPGVPCTFNEAPEVAIPPAVVQFIPTKQKYRRKSASSYVSFRRAPLSRKESVESVVSEESEESDIEEDAHECKEEVIFILEYIYHSFADTFTYHILQTVTSDPPEYFEEDLPYRIEFPKPYLPQTLYAKVSSESTSKKFRKDSKLPKHEEIDENLLIMNELKEDMLKTHILPLCLAVGPEFYDTIFTDASNESSLSKIMKMKIEKSKGLKTKSKKVPKKEK